MPRSTANRQRGTVRAAIPVEPSVLRWARESIGLTLPVAAKKAGIKPEKLEAWEQSEALPTARQLERFANAYKRPLAVFFREQPPQKPPLPADFRVLATGRTREFSPASLLAIRRARYLQMSYVDLHGHSDISIRLGDLKDPERLARETRDRLAVPLDQQLSVETDDAALRLWRGAVERTGLLVFQFPFPVEEMRGFSLPGEVPLIVLNNRDSYTARCFTLFHEAAHVWLGKPGICNPDGRVRVHQTSDRVEVYCNAFAAELLVPMRAFRTEAKVIEFEYQRGDIRTVLDHEARRFHVSPQVILRRLFTAKLIAEGVYQKWAAQLSAEAKSRSTKRKSKGGPAPSRKALSELGEPFVRAVLGARDRGVITDADVTDYLSVGYGHVEKIESMLP